MRSILHFVGYNLKRLFTSPRPYIALLAIYVMMKVGFGGAKSYLLENDQLFQAVELYVFAGNSDKFQLVMILGMLLWLGDAPFLKEGMSLRLIRTNRWAWLVGQILSCVVIAAIYLLAIEVLFLILFSGCVFFRNEWSSSAVLAAQIGNGSPLRIEMATQFSMAAIQTASPYALFGLTFVYVLLLYSFFGVLMIACNLRFRTGVGCFAVALCWCFRLMVSYVLNSELLWHLSPCNLASLFEQTPTALSILYTVMFFLVTGCCLSLLALHSVKTADLLKGDYA